MDNVFDTERQLGGFSKKIATTVSVIIPSAGHLDSLRLCLDSLRAQAIEGNLEVLVVLDGLEAARKEGLAQLRARQDWPWPIKWIETELQRGPAAARNRGIREARGHYLIFLDDDMVVGRDFVAAHLEMLAQNPKAAIIGAIDTCLIGYRGAYRKWMEEFWEERHQRLTRRPVTTFAECFSGNLSIAAADIGRIGGFDEAIATCEDIELGLRLERDGMRLLYGSRALAIQSYRKGPLSYMQEGAIRGATAVQLWRKYPEAREALRFSVPAQGALCTRWLRARALDSRLRWESTAAVLPWLPGTTLTALYGAFLYNLATSRGARRELADEDQWAALSEGTAVLCYRRLHADGERHGQCSIARSRFEGQVKTLAAAGYRFIAMGELIEARKRQEVPRGRTAIIAFEEARNEVAEIAAPILRSMGIPAVIYLDRESIGTPGFLTRGRILQLISGGWEIGARLPVETSWTEPRLRPEHEKCASFQSALTEMFGLAPLSALNPTKEDDGDFETIARRAGYAVALGNDRGCVQIHSPSFNLPRFALDGRWPRWLFKTIVMRGVFGNRRLRSPAMPDPDDTRELVEAPGLEAG